MNILTENSIKLASLCVFRRLLADPVVQRFGQLLATDPSDTRECVAAWSAFASELFARSDNWSRYLLNLALEDENVYVLQSCCGQASSGVADSLMHELEILEDMSWFDGSYIRSKLHYKGFLPSWAVSHIDFAEAYQSRIAQIHTRGYGVFAQYSMFTVADGALVPVRHPDPQRLAQLPGYERERERILANTKALLEGKPANNVLLYGDAGTGKSSTVKAIANEFRGEGLRLIEVKKNQLYQIPDVLEKLAANPLKFILFIDDLSFSSNDSDFAALKAILEGSVNGRSSNIAVYATSNRRHLIKENWEERSGSDLHEQDTRQELMSLSARFGLTVTFERPDHDLYLHIVHELARQYGLAGDPAALDVRAEAHAIRNGGRSPRVARQFVEMVKAGVC